ncbi:MAG TPA: [FeFe] hydrogenase, group A [Candidatus Woesearchaeota archaeon]|nr:[FeFe] hydrogenase, group A [Candidatus Woesearchaeota archaeon]
MRVIINELDYEFNEKLTILDAAKKVGIEIPTFCYHEKLEPRAACRLCVVEVVGRENLLTACSTYIQEGMVINTNSQKVIQARKTNLALLISDHQSDCLLCNKMIDCKLLAYANELNLSITPYYNVPDEKTSYSFTKIDDSSPAFIKNPSRCIKCGLCVQVCDQLQDIDCIDYRNKGGNFEVGPAFNKTIIQTNCTHCGQCVINCPTCALEEKSDIDNVLKAINDKKKIVIAQVAPSIRVSLGEEFGMPFGTIVTGKIPTALKMLGFDYIFDTELGADLTIIEEANELLERLSNKSNNPLPMFTSCCPSWVKMVEDSYHFLIPNLSTCKSPHQMLGSIVKTYFSEVIGIDSKNIVLVSIMPCLSKKFDIARPEVKGQVDYSLTTRELGRMIRGAGINFPILLDSLFDNPLGRSSGAGTLFGSSGGVMEASLRTAYESATGKPLEKIEFKELRQFTQSKYGEINLNEKLLRFASINTLSKAKELIEMILSKKIELDFVEIMACPHGCIGGGGQPIPSSEEIILARAKAIYQNDSKNPIRKCHENPQIKKLYSEYLKKPGSEIAHNLLHTKYYKRTY